MYWTTAVGSENADAIKRINEGREKKREVGAQEFDVKQNKNILYNLYLPRHGTVGEVFCCKTFFDLMLVIVLTNLFSVAMLFR